MEYKNTHSNGGENDFSAKSYDANSQHRYEQRKKKQTKMCRYYKGESENPYEGTGEMMKWYYESCWVDQLSESYQNAKSYRYEAGNHFDDIAEKYKSAFPNLC